MKIPCRFCVDGTTVKCYFDKPEDVGKPCKHCNGKGFTLTDTRCKDCINWIESDFSPKYGICDIVGELLNSVDGKRCRIYQKKQS